MAFAAWDSRAERRYPCNLPARLTAGGLTARGRLMDISRRGAKFAATGHAFGRGQKGALLMGGLRLEVTIVWTNASCAGLGFRRRLDLPPQRLAEIGERLRQGAIS